MVGYDDTADHPRFYKRTAKPRTMLPKTAAMPTAAPDTNDAGAAPG
jgi:hypothetical protein